MNPRGNNPEEPPHGLKTRIVEWMRDNADDFRDPKTEEVNATELAESAADYFGLFYGTNYTVPEYLYDLAVEVTEGWEIQ